MLFTFFFIVNDLQGNKREANRNLRHHWKIETLLPNGAITVNRQLCNFSLFGAKVAISPEVEACVVPISCMLGLFLGGSTYMPALANITR
jgi:hypothetical protein